MELTKREGRCNVDTNWTRYVRLDNHIQVFGSLLYIQIQQWQQLTDLRFLISSIIIHTAMYSYDMMTLKRVECNRRKPGKHKKPNRVMGHRFHEKKTNLVFFVKCQRVEVDDSSNHASNHHSGTKKNQYCI